jgi:hypothetical protein
MKKLTVVLVSSLLFLGLSSVSKALYLEPDTANVTPGSSTTITMKADPPTGSSIAGIKVHITLTNATVTAVTPSSAGLALGTCTDDTAVTFTATTICFDIAKTSALFATDEVVATFTVTWASSGTAIITKDTTNTYVDTINNQEYEDSGQAGSYTIGAVATDTPTPIPTDTPVPTATGTLPETGILEDGAIPILFGCVFVGVGIAVYNYSQNAYTLVTTTE